MSEIRDTELRRLIGQPLNGVSFIMDYLQFQFNDFFLTVLSPVRTETREPKSSETECWRDVLCARIGKNVVQATHVKGEAIRITFDDQSAIVCPLDQPEDKYNEVVILQDRDDLYVWYGGDE